MNREQIAELEAFAKKHGLTINYRCCYCDEAVFTDYETAENFMVTFTRQIKKGKRK